MTARRYSAWLMSRAWVQRYYSAKYALTITVLQAFSSLLLFLIFCFYPQANGSRHALKIPNELVVQMLLIIFICFNRQDKTLEAPNKC